MMKRRKNERKHSWLRGVGLVLVLAMLLSATLAQQAWGQVVDNNNNNNNDNNNNNNNNNNNDNNNNNNNNNNTNGDGSNFFIASRAVGGVYVDPQGMLHNATAQDRAQMYAQIEREMAETPDDLSSQVLMRKVSLRRLDEAIGNAVDAGRPVSDSAQLLGGLLEIRYIVADPAAQDIILIGPGEGWKVSPSGTIVGETTNRPVLLLDDLVTVLRASNTMTPELITCSIDPTQQGLANLQRFSAQGGAPNAAATAAAYRRLLGPQDVSVTGIPATSHYARVLVAADYRMKRIGMGFESSPLGRSLPSYLSMVNRVGAAMPRWWLSPSFETLQHDEERLTWALHGAAVETLTESEVIDSRGQRQATGRSDVAAQRWADLMTEQYTELSQEAPVFGELRNCMDLALVAAVLFKEGLLQRTGCELPAILDENGYATVEYSAPTQIPAESTFLRKSNSWIIGCGGVEINGWAAIDDSEESDELAQLRDSAKVEGDAWYAN
jgi:hypothetical protein